MHNYFRQLHTLGVLAVSVFCFSLVCTQPAMSDGLNVVKHNASSEFTKRMEDTLAKLPAHIRHCAKKCGVKIVIAKSVVDFMPDRQGVHVPGHPEGENWEHVDGMASGGTIIVAETYQLVEYGRDGKPKPPRVHKGRGEGVLRHEFGHAFDGCCGGFSGSQEFKDAYDADVKEQGDDDKNSYLTGHGGGRGEAFAELFALSQGGACNTESGPKLEKTFPRTLALIKKKFANGCACGDPKTTTSSYGTVTETFQDGSTCTTYHSGTTVKEDCGSGRKITERPDGNIDIIEKDGTNIHIYPEGARRTEKKDGTTIYEDKGYKRTTYKDGSSTTELGKTTITKSKDGTTVTESDGDKTTKKPDGTKIIEYKDKTKITKLLDGTKTVEHPDGSSRIEKPNGKIIETPAPGKTQTPTGTTTPGKPVEPGQTIGMQSLKTAITDSVCSLKVIGDGQATAETVLEVTNNTPEPRTVCVEANEALIPDDDQYQVMQIVEPASLTVPPGMSEKITVPTVCASTKSCKPPPTEGVNYTLGTHPNASLGRLIGEIVKVSKELEKTGHFDAIPVPAARRASTIAQLAVWEETAHSSTKTNDVVSPTSILHDALSQSGLKEEQLGHKERSAIKERADAIFAAANLTLKRAHRAE